MSIVVNGTTLTDAKDGNTNITKVYARNGTTGTYVLVFEKGGTVVINMFFGGNWKMNKTKAEIDSYFEAFNANLDLNEQKRVVIFPPTCYLDYVKSKIPSSLSGMVKIGAQSISDHASGAYTGQISVAMAKDCGCDYVLVGQSETRQYQGVTNEMCYDMCGLAKSADLKIIYFIGETLEEREAGETDAVITAQLTAIKDAFSGDEFTQYVTVAYEPVWAIGTDKSFNPDELITYVEKIKNILAGFYDDQTADNTSIVVSYSIKPGNAQSWLTVPYIKGAVIAGQSINANNFATIINLDY